MFLFNQNMSFVISTIKKAYHGLGWLLEKSYPYLITSAIVILLLSLFMDFLRPDLIKSPEVIGVFIAFFALCFALAPTVFSYANSFSDQKKRKTMMIVGERFFLSSIGLLIGLCFWGLARVGYLDRFLEKAPLENFFSWLLVIGDIVLLLISSFGFVFAIWGLIKFIMTSGWAKD
jgi:hypothetical protein